jgi:hypothetical protein
MKKLVLSLILAILSGISAFAANNYDFSAVCESGQTLYYKITSSTEPYTVKVTYPNASDGYYNAYIGYTYPTGTLVIPTSVIHNGIAYSVTSIDGCAFCGSSGSSGSSFTEVTIPESVTSIGSFAFYNCRNLTTINFNATNCTDFGGIGDGYEPFRDCTSLTTLNIGENVTNISGGAFYGISSLTTINFNATNCTSMGSSSSRVFSNNANATINIGNGVTIIPDYAFYGLRGNGTLTIPNSVTSIGNYSFYGCSGLTSVTIPNSVTSIGDRAFYNCSGLTSPVYNANSFAYFPCGYATTYTIPNGIQQIAGGAFSDCSGLTFVTIPNSVTNIGQSAFYNCSGLSSVTIGNGVESIGNSAFYGCNGLTGSLTIPNSVTNIGQSAFYNCSGLTSVTIGNGVTSIGNAAFNNCTSLTAVYYTGTIEQWCGISFGNGYSSTPLYYAHNLYVNNSLLSDLVIPNTVTEIKMHAFHGARCLTSVSIPNTVTSIGSSAFGHCYGLSSVTIPESVTNIGETAFYRCDGLGTVNFNATNCTVMGSSNNPVFKSDTLAALNIGENVTNIPQYAFKNCNGISEINFNAANCTAIGGSLLESGNSLSKIRIGENVATIPNNAFKNCTSLDSIISYAANPPVIYASTFDSQLSLNTPVVVPCGMVETYEDADFWYNFRRIRQRADCGATFTITVMSSNSAWGTVSGGGIYMAGETATLTATPNSGYSFSNWSDGSTENPHQITVTQNDTYIATFVQGGSSNPTVYNSIEATACGSYTWNDHTYTESGEYQQTFTAANSADSIVTLTLTINPAPQPQITLYGELDACNPSSVAFATDQYQSYLWCNGATTMITSTSVPGYYYVEVTDENGCSGRSEQVNIGASNALTEAPQISVVGMNSENHNVVAWSALDNENVNGYNIYRENNVADVYELVANVDASADTYWTDETADPSARAYRYKVTAVDECGGESPMCDYHKTMHLTINQGIGNTWNLIWSYYEGFDFGTYRIYRGTNPSNMTMIGEVPSNLNSYTDNTATASTGYYYQVEVVRNTRSRDAEISSRSNIVYNGIVPEYTITVMSANPNRGTVTGGGTYPEGAIVRIEANALDGFVFTSWSDDNTDNPRYITVTENATYIASFDPATGIEENASLEIALFPNPANDILNITSSETISEIEIVNVMGQVVRRIEVNADNAVCDVEDLTSGVYVVRIHTEGAVVSQRKFIKE